jgi:hypothetical protein
VRGWDLDGWMEMGLVDAVGWDGDRGVVAGNEGGEVRGEGGSWLVRLGCGGCVHEGTGGWGRRREVERCLLKTNPFRAAWQRRCARINEKDGLGVV